jgi:hypothetical protein
VISLPKSIRRSFAIAAIAALALAQSPGASRADDAGPPTEEGPKTVVKYLSCATALAFAFNMSTAVAAFMACAKMFTDEMPA